VQIGQQAGADERGFSAAGGADHREKAVLAQPPEDLLALSFAPEEQVLFIRLEMPQSRKRMDFRLDRHQEPPSFSRNGSSASGAKVSLPRRTLASSVSTSSLWSLAGAAM
jgi:hypothetical protein